MDLLGRWLRRYGRPLALYTDRHSIFEPQDKGHTLPDAVTQFGRALQELGIELICAHSPQAKGRVERSFRGANRTSGRSDNVPTADISNVAKMRTFLWSPHTQQAVSPSFAP